jgi:uncharacterized damage-inducible protein DinB
MLQSMNVIKYLTDLKTNTEDVLDSVRTYSTDELVFRKEGVCSIADLLEHICISESRTLALLKSESTEFAPTNELYGDEKLKKIVVDYKGGPKITEIEINELEGAVTDFSSFEKAFLKSRNSLIDLLSSGQIRVSNKTYKHQYLGAMTVTDWLKYIIYHATRHLNDVKDSSFEFKKAV